MAEYIEREALLSAFVLADCPFTDFEDAFEMVQNAPASDVVPVVRCKDCKFWDDGDCYRLELSRPDGFLQLWEPKEEQP